MAGNYLPQKRIIVTVISLFIFSLITAIAALFIGSVEVNLSDFFGIISGNGKNGLAESIILEIRLPRILLAFAVGGGLSAAGAVFQAILINPLAEPYILGISSGGTFGAVLSFIIGLSFIGTQLFAFGGALLVITAVFMLSRRYGELDPNILLLTGVMVGAFFSAVILLMMTMLNESLRTAIFWLVGNLSLAKAESVYYILPVVIIVTFILFIYSHKFNLISMGAESAKTLGINTGLIQKFTYLLTSLMIGAIVSVSGIIGFVGLLIPHTTRLIFGIDNRLVIPASFFIGAAYLVICDTFARNIIPPAEIPVGAITSIIGAPVFIYLLRKRFYLLKTKR